MDLQRPDSYQGGAGPHFSEHVLHKVKLSPGALSSMPEVLSDPLTFALGLKQETSEYL